MLDSDREHPAMEDSGLYSSSVPPVDSPVTGCTTPGAVSANTASTSAGYGDFPFVCSGCNEPIRDLHLLKADNRFWHEDCLRCQCCDCRLGEVGSSLYTKANLMLCKRDYLRMFGTTGYCAACQKIIPAFELVMRAKSNVYHLECFACQQCQHRFCVGDKFFLVDNKILCEEDYERRLFLASKLVPASGAAFPAMSPASYNSDFVCNYNALSELKQQTKAIKADDSSSGYGSPSPTSL